MAARAENLGMSTAIDTFDDTIIADLSGTLTLEGALALSWLNSLRLMESDKL